MNLYRVFALAGVSLLPLSMPAMAQDAPAAADEGVAETEVIIVQARRREESFQDVPLVVNAVTAQTIEKLNLRNFQDVTAVVPGLSLQGNANGIGSASSLRGVNHDVNVSGENGTIQYYLNDSPIASNIIFQAMYDIGQVEVLRGPQGTLRGRATPSGSITITSRQPNLREPGAYVMGTLGSADTANFNAGINVPVIEDKLAVRVAGLYDFNRGDRVYSVNSSIKPERETKSIRASVRFEPLDFLKLGFTYQALQGDLTAFDQVQSYSQINPTATPSASAPDYGTITPEDRRSTSRLSRTVEQSFQYYNWNAEIAQFGQRLIYVGSHSDSRFHPVTPTDPSNFFPALTAVQDVRTNTNSTTHEVRLQNEEQLLGLFDYVVGYFNSTGSAETSVNSGSIIPVGGPVAILNTTLINIAPGHSKEESVFGNLTLHLGENTEIAGGVRHIHSVSTDGGFFLNGVLKPEADNSYDEKTTIYSASVRHRFNDSLMVYASTGSSWRPGVLAIGDFNAQPYTPNELAHLKLSPETSKSYEVGVKSNWFDKRLLVNLTYYHQDFKNYPFRASGAGVHYVNYLNIPGVGTIPTAGQFNFVSEVPVKVNGVEAEIAYNPSRRFNLSTTINYARSKIGDAMLACTDALNNATNAVGSDGIPDTVVPSVGQMIQAYGSEHLAQCAGSGQRANFQPDWSGSVRAEYNMPVGASMQGFLRGLFAWKGKSFTDPNNRFDDVDAYGILNLYAGLRAQNGAWEVSLYGKNITEVTKTVSVEATPYQLSSPFATLTSRYSGVTVTAPREFGVTARIAFGSR